MAGREHTSAWNDPIILAGTDSTVTLIDGLTLVISDVFGDIGGGADGLICDDTRHLSRLRVSVDCAPLRTLGATQLTPSTARFRGFVSPARGHADATIDVRRDRTVRPGSIEDDLTLSLWEAAPRTVAVQLDVDADFVDIFGIRGLTTSFQTEPSVLGVSADCIRFVDDHTGLSTVVRLEPPPDNLDGRIARWSPTLSRHTPWHLRLSVTAHTGSPVSNEPSGPTAPAHRCEVEVASDPPDLGRGCRRALADLEALSMPDRLGPDRRMIAAGIPWFVALFGRDSLISGLQARAFLPGQVIDTLRALAARQGRVTDAGNEEAPGKILHEVRLTHRPWLGEGTAAGARPYYGTVDATPLWLILYGTSMRWGASRDALTALLPVARAAIDWMRGPGDPDGDGLIEYAPVGTRSLSNQSWKDSDDAVQFADGTLATGPIAMVEVQGYAYRARRDFAAVLRYLGHDAEADVIEAEAAALRGLIRERYWLPGATGGPGFFALALDGQKCPVDSVASNMGHLLWCDVPSSDEAVQVAQHLTGAAMSSGWGLRTLSQQMAGFNPISYHVGSVWPHDTALACEGLRRYELDSQAFSLADDLIAAMALFDHRLPELFGGHAREPADSPAPYPTACRPQAWAAGVPLQLATMFLGLEPDVPSGRLRLSPGLPASLNSVEVRGIELAGGRLSVSIAKDAGVRIIEAPRGLEIEIHPSTNADRSISSRHPEGPGEPHGRGMTQPR